MNLFHLFHEYLFHDHLFHEYLNGSIAEGCRPNSKIIT